MHVPFRISTQQEPGEGATRTVSTQGRTMKRLPTRPTAKINGMILSFFKITCKSVGLWHCCLMVRSIIGEKQHKPNSCHKGIKDISVCLLFRPSLTSLYLEGHTCSYRPCLDARLHQEFSSLTIDGTRHFPVSSSRSNGCLLFLMPTPHDRQLHGKQKKVKARLFKAANQECKA